MYCAVLKAVGLCIRRLAASLVLCNRQELMSAQHPTPRRRSVPCGINHRCPAALLPSRVTPHAQLAAAAASPCRQPTPLPGDAAGKAGVSSSVILELCDELAPGMVRGMRLCAESPPLRLLLVTPHCRYRCWTCLRPALTTRA